MEVKNHIKNTLVTAKRWPRPLNRGGRWIEVSNTTVYWQMNRDFGKWPLNGGWSDCTNDFLNNRQNVSQLLCKILIFPDFRKKNQTLKESFPWRFLNIWQPCDKQVPQLIRDFQTDMVAPDRAVCLLMWRSLHLLLVYLVTALVPSLIACLASLPGKSSLKAVWISREPMVDFLAYFVKREASLAIRSKMSLTNEFMIPMALLEMPESGCTCFSTL